MRHREEKKLLFAQDIILGLITGLVVVTGVTNTYYVITGLAHPVELTTFYSVYAILSIFLIFSIFGRLTLRLKLCFYSLVIFIMSTAVLAQVLWGLVFLYSWLLFILLIVVLFVNLSPKKALNRSFLSLIVLMVSPLIIDSLFSIEPVYSTNVVDWILVGSIISVTIVVNYAVIKRLNYIEVKHNNLRSYIIETQGKYLSRTLENIRLKLGLTTEDIATKLLDEGTRVTDQGLMLYSQLHELENKLVPLYALTDKIPTSIAKEYKSSLSKIRDVLQEMHKNTTLPRQKEYFSLMSVVDCTISKFRPSGVEIEVTFSDDISSSPRIYTQRFLLEQILYNLIDNALKHSNEAEKSTVRIRLSHHDDDYVEIVVENSGKTIPLNKTSLYFMPGYSKNSRGSGMGLYISDVLTNEIGGELFAKRAESGNQQFVLRIPVNYRDDIQHLSDS